MPSLPGMIPAFSVDWGREGILEDDAQGGLGRLGGGEEMVYCVWEDREKSGMRLFVC